MYKLKQDYSNYTDEDREVWRLLYERQAVNFPGRAADAFMEGLAKVGFEADRIPVFGEIDQVLARETGWSMEVVPGLIPDRDFFELLSVKKFPATAWLRKLSELDYLEAPDMFHDVFAHVPILTNQFFVNYLQELSRMALDYIDNPFAIEMIGRIYWFTVEFGLIREDSGMRIYGAGILSSPGETVHCVTPDAHWLPFDVKAIMETHYYKHAFQDRYYVIDSYEQLFGSIPEISHWVEVAVDKYPSVKEDVTKIDIVLN